MKLKVEKEFVDRYTNRKYMPGSEIDVTDERGRELLSDFRKLVSEAERPAIEEKTEETVEKSGKLGETPAETEATEAPDGPKPKKRRKK